MAPILLKKLGLQLVHNVLEANLAIVIMNILTVQVVHMHYQQNGQIHVRIVLVEDLVQQIV